MEVARGKKFSLARGDPPFPSSRLAPWAMPIAAAVIRDGAMSTAGAAIDMAAECGGATPCNGQQDFNVSPADPVVSGKSICMDLQGSLDRAVPRPLDR